MKIKAPYLPYDKIRPLAEGFLNQYNPQAIVPVDVEKIIEFDLGMDIVPYNGLYEDFGTDGFISSDLKSIYVDQRLQNSYENRYRFTLAHEVGHYYLHREIYEQIEFKTIEGWIDVVDSFDSDQYSWFEKQAYDFAGLILVPPTDLFDGYVEQVSVLEDSGFEFKKASIETINEYIANPLSKVFQVSTQVVIKRIAFDDLTPYTI